MAIRKFLEILNVEFKREFIFENCLNSKCLPFDFLINHLLHIILEFDGEQHFYPVEYFGEEAHFKTVENDCIKNQYCIDNNIPLLRIPYWEFDNIESILESTLMHFNIIERGDAYDVDKFKQYLVDKDWDHDEYLSKCPKNKKKLQVVNCN